MNAIPASSVAVRTMADGTLRLSLDIEPRHAGAAFALFGMPGTPAALAALKVGTALPADPEPTEQPKGGPLARWAAMRGHDPRFQEWIEAYSPEFVEMRIKHICGIASRAQLDQPGEAQDIFNTQIRQPWANHCRQKGWAD